MKTALGALTVVICCFLLGRKATEGDRSALRRLDGIIKLIEHIKNEVSASLTPLPDIYARYRFEEKEMKEFGKTLVSQGFARAVETIEIPAAAYEHIHGLATTLGRLDGDSQREKLEQTLNALIRIRDGCRQETERKSKSVQAMFSLAGALAAILMF